MKDHTRSNGKIGCPAYRTPSTFQSKVFAVVKKIPRGKTLTYKQVAQKINKPRAARAVGNALHTNYDSAIPCHRVVRSDGQLGGYNRGTKKKKQLLTEELSQ